MYNEFCVKIWVLILFRSLHKFLVLYLLRLYSVKRGIKRPDQVAPI